MKTSFAWLAIVAGGAMAATANAGLVAYWDFNDSQTGVGGSLGVLNPGGYNAQQGSGVMSTNITPNTNTTTPNGTLGTFSGSSVNLLAPSGSGGALAIQNGASGLNNGNWIQFKISTVGYGSSLVLNYASQRTATGFTDQAISYSTDGINFSSLTTVNGLPSAFALQTVNFGALGVYNQANLYVRFTFSGGSTSASNGNNRIDNVQFNADVPGPGSLSLVGLGGLLVARRRRA
jgi:hypothetical protein